MLGRFGYWLDEKYDALWDYPKVEDSNPILSFDNFDVFLGDYREKNKQLAAKYPVRAFFQWVGLKVNHFAHDMDDWYYWLRGHLWEPHNLLRIKTLPVTWSDRDTRLEHASFQLLTDYIEGEAPEYLTTTWQEVYDSYYYSYEGQPEEDIQKSVEVATERANDQLELVRLYNWWKTQTPSGLMQDGILDEMYDEAHKNKDYTKIYDKEREWEETMTNNLKSLIALRGHLWS